LVVVRVAVVRVAVVRVAVWQQINNRGSVC
jgi:hypothetical protein